MNGAGPALKLHDLALAEPVAWTPQTAGWAVLGGAVLIALAWGLVGWLRRRRANRYRRSALARLDRIEGALRAPDERARALAELPVLVKQTALACRSRAEVAALSGDAWLRYLDDSLGGREFRDGAGRLLPTLAYDSPATIERLGGEEVGELVGLVRRWIREHPADPALRRRRVRV